MFFLVFLRRFRVVLAALIVFTFLTGCGMMSVLVEEQEEGATSNDLDSNGGTENCGNGIIERNLGEFCDGANLGGATCRSLGRAPGELRCTEECTLDVSFCGSSGPIGDGGGLDGGGNFLPSGRFQRPGDGGLI